jgi:ABC-type glycerol-3-phosphate transport system substrate-binding protein
MESSIPQLILNENLFRKADIDPTNPENIPETWEDVGKIGGEIFEKIGRDEDGNIVYEGWDWAYNNRISWRRQDVRTLMAHYGAKFVNDDGEIVVDSPEAIKAIQTMKDMIHKHKTGDPNSLPGAEGRDWQIHNGFMALGRFPGGELTNMVAPEDTKDQLKVYPFPKPADREKVVTIRSHTFMVNGSISEKKQLEAWKFINFLTTKKFKTLVGSMGQISARMMVPEFDKPWFETEWFENKKAELHSLQSQPIEALANGKAVWASGSELYGTEEAVLKADEIADVVAEEMERVIFTNSDVEEALKRAKARIESILN